MLEDVGVGPGWTGRAPSVRSRGLRRKRVRSAVAAPLSSLVRAPAPPPPGQPLRPLIAVYTASFGASWGPVTRRKHADDFARFVAWLEANDRPVTTASLDFLTLVTYVTELRSRPKVRGVWRGRADAQERSAALGPAETLSANTVNAYMRPIRGLAIWLVDEGILTVNPFRRSRRRASLNPLLPSEETPTKSATLDDLRALERGCAGDRPIDLRDRAMVSILLTTAARNSSVRLLRLDDLDFERSVIRFRRAKGAKTLEVALHPDTRAALETYLESGRPALVRQSSDGGTDDPGWLFPSARPGPMRPLTMNATSTMVGRHYHAGGGSLRAFGSHRIRHGTATALANHGMGLEELSRFMGHASTTVTRRYAQQTPDALGARAADALERAGLSSGVTGEIGSTSTVSTRKDARANGG